MSRRTGVTRHDQRWACSRGDEADWLSTGQRSPWQRKSGCSIRQDCQEPPDADPHVRWCGRRGEKSPRRPDWAARQCSCCSRPMADSGMMKLPTLPNRACPSLNNLLMLRECGGVSDIHNRQISSCRRRLQPGKPLASLSSNSDGLCGLRRGPTQFQDHEQTDKMTSHRLDGLPRRSPRMLHRVSIHCEAVSGGITPFAIFSRQNCSVNCPASS